MFAEQTPETVVSAGTGAIRAMLRNFYPTRFRLPVGARYSYGAPVVSRGLDV